MVHRGNTDQNMGGFGDGIGDVEELANDNFGKPLLCSQKFSEYPKRLSMMIMKQLLTDVSAGVGVGDVGMLCHTMNKQIEVK